MVERRKRKISQVIWLEPELMLKIMDEQVRRGFDGATNEFIVTLLREYFDRPERVVEKEVVKEVPREVTVEREIYVCPWCYQRMNNLEALRLHISGLHSRGRGGEG